ncbi:MULTISPECIES: carbamate kinase [unclassified Brevibacterium]|uniref:carbamate kinase n=1 Tax=unclassified Brevibacterium TaxID=2614124 RepID=UPI00254E5472|nr:MULTISPECIES: carbamate kinase [unclassified Brevibacterium]MCD1286878.1 carbamate kinase [Brevibacterium sp. CCUG 69071]MDK8433884.1 carbamate kinase [Brevibacterium sp. H-BE7]
MRVLVALGGNAMTGLDGDASPSAQQHAIAAAAVHLAELTAAGHELVITHGNGPQVGNILRKNELSAHELPPVSLDWCGAQTQGTIGFTIVNELEREFAAQGLENKVAAVVTRTVVDSDDPAFADPVKPIGSYQDADFAAEMTAHGQTWKDFGEKGWRRVVASPAPVTILETPMVSFLADSGWVVVAAGGGGIPVVAADGGCTGISAVIDKDLSAARLAASVGADLLIIATDVPCAVAGYGTPEAEDVGAVTTAELKGLRDTGTFASGSMGPKVDAIIDFVDNGGTRAVIAELSQLSAAAAGTVGTVVTADDQ